MVDALRDLATAIRELIQYLRAQEQRDNNRRLFEQNIR